MGMACNSGITIQLFKYVHNKQRPMHDFRYPLRVRHDAHDGLGRPGIHRNNASLESHSRPWLSFVDPDIGHIRQYFALKIRLNILGHRGHSRYRAGSHRLRGCLNSPYARTIRLRHISVMSLRLVPMLLRRSSKQWLRRCESLCRLWRSHTSRGSAVISMSTTIMGRGYRVAAGRV